MLLTAGSTGFLIAAAVHHDAVPGAKQDWLIRPVKRRDLLLAKFVFVLVVVHGPMLAADLTEGLAFGFPFGQSLGAAVSHGLYLLITWSIPVLAFASLTRNAMEAIVGGVVLFGALLALSSIIGAVTVGTSIRGPVVPTSLAWLPGCLVVAGVAGGGRRFSACSTSEERQHWPAGFLLRPSSLACC